MLDDGRDAVRNAGLLLLVDLTSGANEDLRKIVAFEDVFVKVFALIKEEGGLAEAGITAQDCLSLLAHLITSSASNQTMFRESGCVAQLAQLLEQVFPSSTPEAAFILQNREKSAFGLLQLLRFFFVPGESSTSQNQAAFFRAGTGQMLIDIGFSAQLPIPIRTASLKCVADLIASNPPIQETFAALTVVTPSVEERETPPVAQTNGTRSAGPSNKGSARESAEKPRTYIIEALLDLTLDQPQDNSVFRTAACGLIQAYLVGHDRIKSHFLQRAIHGHAQQESAANVLTKLTQPDGDATGLVFASWIVQDLIADNADPKTALAAVKEGDESEGEDVLTFIQALSSQLEGALLQATDEAVVSAYASLLTLFLWEFADGVDDLLAESSSLLQALASAPKSRTPTTVTSGLAATLLGTIYEFSTKDSPIPRRTIAPMLTQKLSRSKYLDALAELRRDPVVRDFELREEEDSDTLFCKSFINLFTVEYSRLRKAIDKDPGVEVLPPSAAEAGVDRDVLDDLRQQLQQTKDALTQAQADALEASQKHEQESLAAAKELQTAFAEVERLQRINHAMQQGHESELEDLVAQHEEQKQSLSAEHQSALDAAQNETQQKVQTAIRERGAEFHDKMQEYERRLAETGNAQRAEQSAHASKRQQFEALSSRHKDLESQEKTLSEQYADLTQRHSRLEREHQQLQTSSGHSITELERLRKESEGLQAGTDRMTTQSNELQEELKAKERELAAERAGFADLEKELENAKKTTTSDTAPDSNFKSVDNGDTGAGKLEEEVREAKEAEKSAREELESMLLVMGDIEAKRDAYRERVRALGGDVSDEDEGEGEDGDEEEGDEEDEDDID